MRPIRTRTPEDAPEWRCSACNDGIVGGVRSLIRRWDMSLTIGEDVFEKDVSVADDELVLSDMLIGRDWARFRRSV